MTPLQASVLLNETIELLETTTRRMVDDESQGSTRVWAECEGALARLRSFRDGFFRNIRTQNNHPVKVPAVPNRPVLAPDSDQELSGPCQQVIGVDPATSDRAGCVVVGYRTPDGVLIIDEVRETPKVPAVPRDSRYVSSYTGMLTRDLDDRDS